MNRRIILHHGGIVMVLVSGIMILVAAGVYLMALIRGSTLDTFAHQALSVTGLGGLLIGVPTWLLNRGGSKFLARKEAMLLVAGTWVVGAALAGMPYYLWAKWKATGVNRHVFQNFVSCYFEAMSGLTTTGATVLSDIESMPRSLLVWRATTHWLGGLGIVVLFVAVLPGLGVGGKRMFMIEAPGPAPEGLVPKIRETAKSLWYIYLGLTAAQVLALLPFMSLYESICHTFATLATGGFSTRNASTGAFHHQPMVDVIVVFFMILAGANFGLYYRLTNGDWRSVLRDTELRLYLFVLLFAAAVVSGAVYFDRQPIVLTNGTAVEATAVESVRQGVVTTVSIQTTTGFCTSDFNRWPFLAQGMLVLLMFIGGCSGSTAGGIKVVRVWIALKVLTSEVEKIFRPDVIRPVRLGKATMDPELKLGTVCYFLGCILIFTAGAGAVMLLEQLQPDSPCDFTTAATASAATLFTIGPGLAKVGAIENYGWMSEWSKAVLCVLMAFGRLEIFAIIVLFTPSFWKSD